MGQHLSIINQMTLGDVYEYARWLRRTKGYAKEWIQLISDDFIYWWNNVRTPPDLGINVNDEVKADEQVGG